MNLEKTQRGFVVGYFKDTYGEECSIQESSAVAIQGGEGASGEWKLWLGRDEVRPKVFRPGCGWSDVELPGDGKLLLSGRMHLSQTQAAELIPLLQHFVEHGELPRPEASQAEGRPLEGDDE